MTAPKPLTKTAAKAAVTEIRRDALAARLLIDHYGAPTPGTYGALHIATLLRTVAARASLLANTIDPDGVQEWPTAADLAAVDPDADA